MFPLHVASRAYPSSGSSLPYRTSDGETGFGAVGDLPEVVISLQIQPQLRTGVKGAREMVVGIVHQRLPTLEARNR